MGYHQPIMGEVAAVALADRCSCERARQTWEHQVFPPRVGMAVVRAIRAAAVDKEAQAG